MLITVAPSCIRIVVAAALCAASGLSAAQFQLRTAPATLNTDATTDTKADISPSVKGDGSGNWVAVWSTTESNQPTLIHLVAAHSTDNGATWSAPTFVDPNGATDDLADFDATLETDGAGTWIVFWRRQNDSNPPLGDVYRARSTDNGVTWSTPAAADHTVAFDNNSGTPDVAADGAGNWVAVWPDTTASDPDVFASSSTDNGLTWSPLVLVNLDTATSGFYETDPRIATDGSGTWIVVWTSHFEYEPGDELDTDILISSSTDNGATWTYPGAVNPNAEVDDFEDQYPSIATDGAGTWIAVWSSYDDSINNDDDDVVAATSTNAGATWTAPVMVNSDADTDGVEPDRWSRITTDGAGNWVASWWKFDTSVNPLAEPEARILARSADNGASWGPRVRIDIIHGHGSGFADGPEIVTDGTGVWMAIWEQVVDVSSDNDDGEIYFTRWTNILAPDRDGDNLSDADETTAGTSSDSWDTDGDLLSDADEITLGTNPLLVDTDGDGVWDGIEIALGTDPLDPFDFPTLPLNRPWLLVTALIAAVIALHGRGGFRFRA